MAALPGTGGLVAVSTHPGRPSGPDLDRALARSGAPDAARWSAGAVQVASWGALRVPTASADPIALNLISRGPTGDVAPPDLRSGHGADRLLSDLMPPFAAVQVADDAVTAVTDAIGFRHLYYHAGDGWSAISTSTRTLAALAGTGLDRVGVGFQSVLGWQIGDRTLFEGVGKLRDGERVVLESGHARVERYRRDARDVTRRGNATAIPEAAEMLRCYLDGYLDDHPDAVLQLTGGIDSRILLAAIDPARRRGLRALTLAAEPDSEDVRIAAELCQRNGMEHLVYGFEELRTLGPEQAFLLVQEATAAVDGMADPLAMAALSLVEGQAPQGPRISGLGGEVARGFYYVGPSMTMPVTRPATRLLTAWRMFANESVSEGVLEPAYAKEVRAVAEDDIYRTLRATGRPWMAATDHFYLYERMQRWAGVTDTAVCLRRPAVNPMLDRRFLDIAASLPPSEKAASRFLAGLLCHLDPELADIPMDGRQPPRTYVDPSWTERFSRRTTVVRKGYRKVRQRLNRSHRPPAGGVTLADLVVRHWRARPEVLAPAAASGLLRAGWVEEVCGGSRDPDASDVAFVTTLVAAQSAID
jgi:asparagine synthase (glutamine-hydrolysing)